MVDTEKPPQDKNKDKEYDVGCIGSDLKLDIYDHLYLHPQDIGSQLVTFKLEGTENYKVRYADVQLALHTRNKGGFITEETYNKQDGYVIFNLHHKTYTLTQFWMSLSEYYHECNALWRQFDSLVDLPACTCESTPKVKKHVQLLRTFDLLDVKSTFATLSRDESHRNHHVASKTVKSWPIAFAARPSNNNWNSNRNNKNITSSGNNNNRRFGRVSNLVCKHFNMTGHTIDRTDHSKSTHHTLTSDQYQMTLLSDTGNASKSHASVAADLLFDLMDATHLNLTVSHHNGIMAHVKQVGSYKLANDLIIKDVPVVPDYHVSLVSVHKLSRDNKVIVSFNDSKCKLQDSTQRILMETGSERGDLDILLTKLPTVVLSDKSPYELVYKTEPNLLHLKTFSYLCFSTMLHESDKFESRVDKCVFVGYAFDKNGYKLFNLDQKKFVFSRDVNLMSNEPCDDGEDNEINGNKFAPDSNIVSPFGSTSSRKDTGNK
ncbi:hypothetical protein Tco_1249960 [Tanacetum coccineum]